MPPASPPLVGGAFTTPLGTLVALASDRGLRAVSYDLDLLAEAEQEPSPALDRFATWLGAYFDRRFRELPPLDLDLPEGLSAILEQVRAIPVGRTTTYGAIAKQVGRPQAARAVGAAVGRNPLMLVVPCHRVLAASGSLSGYAGGIERKAWLLRHEGYLLL